jgi:hypothetical protein
MFAHHLERHVLDNGFVTLSIPFPSHDERSLAYAESKFRRGHLTRWFFVVNEARRIVLHRSRREAFAVQARYNVSRRAVFPVPLGAWRIVSPSSEKPASHYRRKMINIPTQLSQR